MADTVHIGTVKLKLIYNYKNKNTQNTNRST